MRTACMSQTVDKCVADTLQKLPHSPAHTFLPLSSGLARTRKGRGRSRVARRWGGRLVMGVWVGAASWEQAGLGSMSLSFHASFIHFITSLEKCEGVEKKPCHPETEREGSALRPLLLPRSGLSLLCRRLRVCLGACSVQGGSSLHPRPPSEGLWAAIWAHFIRWHTVHVAKVHRCGGNAEFLSFSIHIRWMSSIL